MTLEITIIIRDEVELPEPTPERNGPPACSPWETKFVTVWPPPDGGGWAGY